MIDKKLNILNRSAMACGGRRCCFATASEDSSFPDSITKWRLPVPLTKSSIPRRPATEDERRCVCI